MTTFRRAGCAVAVVAVVGLAGAPAGGEEAGGAIAAGERAFAGGDYEAALRAFRGAYEATGMAALLYNVAMCLYELDRPAEAINAFRTYLAEEREGLSAEDLAEIERVLSELGGRVGELALEVSPPGARVLVDDEEVGVAPLRRPVAVLPGERTVTAEAEGMERRRVEARVGAGERVVVRVALAPVGRGHGAVDGGEEELEPVAARRVRAGGPPPWWFWAATGVTAAAAVSLSVTGGLALQTRDDYEAGGRLDLGAYDRGRALGTATDALVGVAGVAAAAAVLSLALHLAGGRSSEPEETEATAARWPVGWRVR